MDVQATGTKRAVAGDSAQQSGVYGTKRLRRDGDDTPGPASQHSDDEIVVVDLAENAGHSDSDWEKVDGACARWCSPHRDGSYGWDESRIKSFLSSSQRDDSDYVRNLVLGAKPTSQLHPLLFDSVDDEDNNDSVRLRSLPFLRDLAANAAAGRAEYAALTDTKKRLVGIGVRDLFLAASRGLLSDEERHILKSVVDILDESTGSVEIEGMTASFHPSARYKVAKFVGGIETRAADTLRPFFAQVMSVPRLFVVFVDPGELSFHNFENIVPLDRWIETRPGFSGGDDGGLSISLEDCARVKEGMEIFTCKLRGEASAAILKQLSSLDLYIPPLNKSTRGGERFIFQSSLLSKALTEAVRESDLLGEIADGALSRNFKFVNYVFRCNRFSPDSAKFDSHRDTPYYDSARAHVSKYTLLIYLTSGRGEPALSVKGAEMRDVEALTCVVFDQSYEHEGRPFVDGKKIFLRTELIYRDKKLRHDPQIGSLFGRACYFTGQGLFNDELARYAHDCYERANSLHWAVEREPGATSVYLRKRFRGLDFVTNGYDYWFPKLGGASGPDCGMVAVLDYFNCKIAGEPFRSLCWSTTLREKVGSAQDVWKLLAAAAEGAAAAPGEVFKRLDKDRIDAFRKSGPDKPFVREVYEWDDPDEEYDSDGDGCCPLHSHTNFNPWKNEDVVNMYEACWLHARAGLYGAPLLLLGGEAVINEENVRIEGDKMYFLVTEGGKVLPPVNFAACWGDRPFADDYVGVGEEIPAPKLLVPPIQTREHEECFHLVLDFFRNDWVVDVDEGRTLPVPVVLMDDEQEELGELGVEDESDKPRYQYVRRFTRKSFEFYEKFEAVEDWFNLHSSSDEGSDESDGW